MLPGAKEGEDDKSVEDEVTKNDKTPTSEFIMRGAKDEDDKSVEDVTKNDKAATSESIMSEAKGKVEDDKRGEVTKNDKIPTSEFASEKNQKARAFLRERFLRALTGIVGKKCELQMYNNTTVNAEFRGCDVNVTRVSVTDLKTPMGVMPKALLRTSDIISLQVNNIEGALPQPVLHSEQH